jgi:thioesterase domain-containing protein
MKYLKLYEQFRLLLEADEKKDNTILYNLSNKGEKTIVLLPGSGKDGGQGKDDFQSLATTLVKDFSVYSADFLNDLDVREYAKNIANEINNNDDIKQCAVGGFSIGGAIAWHLANALKGSKKFNNQLFFIDSGIPNSTEEFAENIVKGNTPRIAMATPVGLIKKARSGGNFTKKEIKSVKHIYTDTELTAFREENKGNYIEYINKDFPPSNTILDAAAKAINEKTPDKVYIIEDKYDKTEFKVRYSVKPKEIKEKSFKEGDVINNRYFVMQDTLKKKGLGRESEDGMLAPLDGVEVISLIAGNKEGKARPKEDIEASKKEAEGSTTPGKSKLIVITGTEHGNITKSPDLAKNISSSFK